MSTGELYTFMQVAPSPRFSSLTILYSIAGVLQVLFFSILNTRGEES